jgi:hypothetical protein
VVRILWGCDGRMLCGRRTSVAIDGEGYWSGETEERNEWGEEKRS